MFVPLLLLHFHCSDVRCVILFLPNWQMMSGRMLQRSLPALGFCDLVYSRLWKGVSGPKNHQSPFNLCCSSDLSLCVMEKELFTSPSRKVADVLEDIAFHPFSLTGLLRLEADVRFPFWLLCKRNKVTFTLFIREPFENKTALMFHRVKQF